MSTEIITQVTLDNRPMILADLLNLLALELRANCIRSFSFARTENGNICGSITDLDGSTRQWIDTTVHGVAEHFCKNMGLLSPEE